MGEYMKNETRTVNAKEHEANIQKKIPKIGSKLDSEKGPYIMFMLIGRQCSCMIFLDVLACLRACLRARVACV